MLCWAVRFPTGLWWGTLRACVRPDKFLEYPLTAFLAEGPLGWSASELPGHDLAALALVALAGAPLDDLE